MMFGGKDKRYTLAEDDDDKDDDSEQKITRENNHIFFYSEVDRKSIFELVALIRKAEEECIITAFKYHLDEIPIYLHISSFGGYVNDAFNAIDYIINCKVPVYTIVEGPTASAGTLISVVGKKRYMTEHAEMLIHQLSSSFWGKMTEINDEYKNLKVTMKKLRKLYKKYTGIPKIELKKILSHDLWFTSEKCLEFRLVDEIWRG